MNSKAICEGRREEKEGEGSAEGLCSLPNVWVLPSVVWVERGRGSVFSEALDLLK